MLSICFWGDLVLITLIPLIFENLKLNKKDKNHKSICQTQGRKTKFRLLNSDFISRYLNY
jgi:hypothetical protein